MRGYRAAQAAYDAREPSHADDPDCPSCGASTSNYGTDADADGPCWWVGDCDGCIEEMEEDDA